MSQYVAVAAVGPSAAFFDLDRTLISGSSAFTLAIAARAMKMVPTHELVARRRVGRRVQAARRSRHRRQR